MNCLIYLIKYIVLRIFSSWFCQCICDSVWLRCDYWTHQHFSLPKLNNGNQHFDNEHTVGRFVRNVARQRCGKRKWKSEQNVSKCLQSFGINAGSTINLVSSYHFSAVKPEAEPLSWKFWRKRRYIVVVMAFCGFFNVYSLRVNLSVGIVAMTENRTVHYENGTIGWVSDWQSYMYVLNYMFTNWFPKLWPLHSGTRLPMGFQRERPNFELIFLGLHYDTIPWRSIWRQNWR